MSFNHVGVTPMERLDQDHLYPLGEHRDKQVTGGAHSTKELSRQLICWLFGTSIWPGGERYTILYTVIIPEFCIRLKTNEGSTQLEGIKCHSDWSSLFTGWRPAWERTT